MMSPKGHRRGKARKRPNRYNPNKPDWRKVHLPGYVDLPVMAFLLK